MINSKKELLTVMDPNLENTLLECSYNNEEQEQLEFINSELEAKSETEKELRIQTEKKNKTVLSDLQNTTFDKRMLNSNKNFFTLMDPNLENTLLECSNLENTLLECSNLEDKRLYNKEKQDTGKKEEHEKSKFSELKIKFETEKELRIQTEKNMEALCLDLQKANENIESMSSLVKEKENLFLEADRQIKDLKEEQDQLKFINSELEVKSESEKELRIQTEKNMEALCLDLQKANENIESMSSLVKEKENLFLEADRQIKDLKEEQDQLKFINSELEVKSESEKELRIQTEKNMEALCLDLQKANENIESMSSLVKEKENLFLEADRQIKDLKEEQDQLKFINSELEVKSESEKELRIQTEKNMEALCLDLQKANENIESMSSLVKEKENLFLEADRQIKDLKEEQDQLKIINSELEVKSESEKELRIQTEKNMEALCLDLQKANENIESMSSLVKEKENLFLEADRQIKDLKEEQDQLKIINSELEVKSESEKELRIQTEKNMEALCLDLQKANENIESMSSLMLKNEEQIINLNLQKQDIEKKLILESEEFDEIENTLRSENFKLKYQLIKYKLHLKIITEDEACFELGFDISKLYDDQIKI